MVLCLYLVVFLIIFFFFFSSRRRHTRLQGDWSSDVCSSDLVLGGFSYFDMGVNPPYNFHLLAGHGGLGDRIFLTDRLALRLEARAYYAPKSCCLSSTWVGHVLGSAGLSFFIGGGGPHEELPPPIPQPKRDSIIAAGGKPPQAPPPTRAGANYEQRTSDPAHQTEW